MEIDKYYDSATSDYPAPVKGLVVVGRYIVGPGLRLIFRARYEGREVFDRLPEGRPVIVAGNHSSYTDPLFVFDALWPRRVRYMAKGQLFEHKFLDRILAWFGVFPVYTDARGRKAIKRSIACLKRGEYLGIFPEGTRVKKRDKTDVESSDGVGLIAKMAGAIIVPVGIEGTLDISPNGSKLLHFPKVTLRFGEPLSLDEFPGLQKAELFSAVTKETMRRVYALAEGRDPGPMPAPEAQEAPARDGE